MNLKNNIEQLISELTSISNKAIVATNKKGEILFINSKFEKLSNYSIHDLKNKKLRDIFILQKSQDKANLTVKSGNIYKVDFHKITSIYDADLIIINNSENDIDTKFSEISECAKFFDYIRDAILILDANKNILYLNDYACEIFQKPCKDILGKKCYKVHRDAGECSVCAVTESLKTQKVVEEHIYKPEINKWFSVRAYPILTKEGELDKVIEHFRDITEEKNAELDIKKSKIEWSQVFDAIEHPTFILSPDNIILEVNKAVLKLFNAKSETEIIGKKCYEIFHGSSSAPKFCPSITMKETGKPYSDAVECEIDKQSFIVSCTPIYDDSHNLQKIIHVATNISHLKSIEENLVINKEKLSLLMDNIPGVAYRCLYDSNWTMLFLSKEFKTLTGYNISDFLNNKNKAYTDIIHPEDKEKVWVNISKSITKQKSFVLEYKIITKANTIKHVWEKGKLISRNDKQYIEGVIFDITERKTAEINLKQSEEKYRLLVENQNEVILKFNRHGNFTYLSKSFYKIFAKNETEDYNKRNFAEFILEEEQERIFQFVSSLKYPPYTGYVEHKTLTNKGMRWYGWSNKAIINASGKITEIIAVGRDITERKIIESELKKAKENIEQKEVNRTIFTTNIIKETKLILNNLLKHSELLVNKDIKLSEKEKYANLVNSSSKQISEILNNFSEIAQLESKDVNIEKTYFNISDLIDELKDYYRAQAEEKNLEFVVLKPIEKGLKLHTDKSKLKHILSNLLNNALKFTSFGSIKLGYKQEKNKVKIFVADTGIGIEPSNHKIIFDKFTQIKTKNQEFEGSGLGLSIVKELCDLLGIEILLNSSLKNGAEFSFLLEYVNTDIEQPVDTNTDLEFDFSNLNILITEDEQVNYLLLKTILNKAGAKTLRAQTGYEAIEFVKNQETKIDIILMDIKLPGLSGSDALLEIKNINSKIPIIACTAYTQNEDAQNLLKQGFNDYIAKPINLQELLSIIKKNVLKV